MAGFMVMQTQDGREAMSRSGNLTHRSYFHCLAAHSNEVAIGIPDLAVLLGNTLDKGMRPSPA